ncbi:uncharacterized protein LOC121368738 [Gigantopelta aegis]|uniref:uncharacterized protein LOC121368738 n=1 Tax=Gigantopelta aegis TaxID=1735272 RepID=UPI001B88B7BC|nr:uncharacterized protein LOC121368738 [Gigantopelta aegis]
MVAGALLCLLVLINYANSATVHLYVGPNGSDSNNGLDETRPLKTLDKARQKLDENGIKGNTVFVELLAGYHDLSSTLHFTHGYSHPVTFRAYKHQEVHVTGGKRIDSSLFHHVTDHTEQQRLPQVARNKVVKVHLPDAGITDYGHVSRFGFGSTRTAPLELFINGNPTRFAQWPNEGFINIKTVLDGAQGKRFTYSDVGNRDSNWVHEKEPWAYGYWYWGWADDAVQVTNIDAHSKTMTLANNPRFGLRIGSLPEGGYARQGGYFRVINMLCELDEPGESYIDRSTGDLYVWPNTPSGRISNSDVVYASLIGTCISMDSGVNNLVFYDFSIEACRYFGFKANSVHNIKFLLMEVKNTGAVGISLGGDSRSITISRCEIHHGDGGIYISGGVRSTLTPSGNLIEDNHIWWYSRMGAVGKHGIDCNGVHNTIRHNHMHDGQYTAIWWSGNDHVMEYNHIWNSCVNASDCGAVHAGRDWTNRGNVIRYNYIHHTLRYWPGSTVRGIMLDDQYSSVNIEHNVFYDNEVHANIGGGRDNIVRYNVFYNATSSSLQCDGRGLPHGNRNSGTLDTRLKAVPYTSQLWKDRYPKLAAINQGNRYAPEGNQIYDNVYYNHKGIRFNNISPSIQQPTYVDSHDNYNSRSPTDFWSPKNADFRLRCLAADWANSENVPQPISVDRVGPQHKTGPYYLHSGQHNTHHLLPHPAPCEGTVAPATKTPKTPYLSDGSGPNTIHPEITNHGCWLIITGCPLHPTSGTSRDHYGEQHEHSGTDQEACLARAAKLWNYCGSPSNHTVTAVFGPTGAMTVAGTGCYFADYGCPKHKINHGSGALYRDSYGEQHGGLHNEKACLDRARGEWVWCGSDPDFPVTSLYRPTGKTSTAGGGCWIQIKNCPADSNLNHKFFYDAWGATNLDTGVGSNECFDRATFYWRKCGSYRQFPVTAHFRPTASSHTVPVV